MGSLRVGVYVDAFNLYYGGRESCGRGTPGWRWLDIRALATTLVSWRRDWAGALLDRVVYCTAQIDAANNPSGHADQDVYLKALLASGSVDHIELGYYVARVKRGPLALADGKGRPRVARAGWTGLVMPYDSLNTPMPDASFLVSYATREEKGSDVNIASHLLTDTLRGEIDAAVVISNDSDLRYPIDQVRQIIPVGTVNPTPKQTAGALRGTRDDGVGRHWWIKLTAADFKNHQLPDPAGGYTRPSEW